VACEITDGLDLPKAGLPHPGSDLGRLIPAMLDDEQSVVA